MSRLTRKPCSRCGSTGRRFSIVRRDSLSLSESFGSTHEFLEERPLEKWLVVFLAVGSPFLGLALGGITGVVGGLAVSALSYWLGPRAATKVRETTRWLAAS